MPVRLCAACSRPPGNNYVLCPGCGDRMADHLHAVGDVLDDLDVTRAHMDVLIVSIGRGGEPGLPFGQAAALAYHHLVGIVGYWAIQLADARSAPDRPPSAPAAAVWLARRLDWVRALDNAGTAYCDLDAAMARARCVIDRPLHRAAFRVGPCPELRDGAHCPGQIWAYIPVRMDADPAAVLRCRHPDCYRHREPWVRAEWRDAGVRILRRQVAVRRSSGDRPSYRSPYGGT